MQADKKTHRTKFREKAIGRPLGYMGGDTKTAVLLSDKKKRVEKKECI